MHYTHSEILKLPIWNPASIQTWHGGRPKFPHVCEVNFTCAYEGFLIGHFRVPPGPLYQNEVKCSAFDMKMIFHSHANKTHFHRKGCVSTRPHFESEGFWNSEEAYFFVVHELLSKQMTICIGNSMICSDICHKYEWYFEIVIRNFTSR